MRRHARLIVAMITVFSILALFGGYASAVGSSDDGAGVPDGSTIPGGAKAGNCDTLDAVWTVTVQSKRALKYACSPNIDITNWSLTTEDRNTVTLSNNPNGLIYAGQGKSYDITLGQSDGVVDTFHAHWEVSGSIPSVPSDFTTNPNNPTAVKTGEVQGVNFLMFFQLPRYQNAVKIVGDTTDCLSPLRLVPFFTGNDDYFAIDYSVSLTPDQEVGPIPPNTNSNLLVRKEVGIASYDSSALSLGAVPAKFDVDSGTPTPGAVNQTRCQSYPQAGGTYAYGKVTENGDIAGVPKQYNTPGTVGVQVVVSGNSLDVYIPFVYHTYALTTGNSTTRVLAQPGDPVTRIFPAVQALVNVFDVPKARTPAQTPTVNDPRPGTRPALMSANREVWPGTYLKLNPYLDWASGSAFDIGDFSGTLTIGAEVVHTAQCPDYEGSDTHSIDIEWGENLFQANPLFDDNLLNGATGYLHYDSKGVGTHTNATETPSVGDVAPIGTWPKTQDRLGPVGCSQRIPTAQRNVGNLGTDFNV